MTSEEVWRADFDKVDAAVQPFIQEDEDGAYISPNCPQQLSKLYNELLSMGYFHGWIE